ncbi:hypothetical protein [Streptomyces sp. NPDC048603]|uniref:hypothetical protein n=1 Tax=Streptomyces sp. NPDC048603 TaxID=3365577 RepID=UPI0037205623
MTAGESTDHVSLHLSDCDHETAEVVFDALRHSFSDVSAPGGTVRATSGGSAATVWSLTVDASARKDSDTAPAALDSPVTAELYGPAEQVRLVREELERAFAVQDLGTVPGEHEVETRLRLTAR